MPKAKLAYKLPEEQDDFRLAIDGGKWYSVAWEIDQQLRTWLRHGHEFPDGDAALEAARTALWAVCEDNAVSFDDVA